MALAHRSQGWNGGHGPVEAAEKVGVPVAEPVLEGTQTLSAARDFAVGSFEIGGVIERPDGAQFGWHLSRVFVIEGVDGGPTGGVATEPRRRTAQRGPDGRALLVDPPGSVEGADPEVLLHPGDQVAHLGLPLRIGGTGVREVHEVQGGIRRRRLVEVRLVLGHVLEVARPTVVGGAAGVELVGVQPPSRPSGEPARTPSHCPRACRINASKSRRGETTIPPKVSPSRVAPVRRSPGKAMACGVSSPGLTWAAGALAQSEGGIPEIRPVIRSPRT